MQYIKLRRNGAFEIYTDDKFTEVISKSDLYRCLTIPLRLEDGIIFEEVIRAAPEIYKFIPWSFDSHMKELELPPTDKKAFDIEYLEIYRHVMIDDGVGFEKDQKNADAEWKKMFGDSNLTDADMASIEVSLDFHGIGFPLEKDDDHYKVGERINYGLSFTKVCDLKHLPVKIKHQSTGYFRFNEKITEVKSGDKYDFNPSVLDFYYAIVYECTWHGSCEERDAVHKELMDRVDDAKEQLKDKENEGEENA